MTSEPRSDSVRGAAPGPLAGVERWAWAFFAGVLAAGINMISVPLLTEETPLFIFGGFLVYFVLARLGWGPGVLTAAVMMGPQFVEPVYWVHPGVVAGALIYVVEAALVHRILRRVGSLILSAVVFWAGVGWVLDLGIYWAWMGLDPAYVALLFTKQTLNQMLNASLAELLLTAPVLRRLPGALGGHPRHGSIRTYVFNRMTLVASLPTVVLAILFARARYEGDLMEAREASAAVAVAVVDGIEAELEARSVTLGRAAMRIASTGVGSGALDGAEAVLSDLVEEHAFYAALLTGPDDRVRVSYPPIDLEGAPIAGTDLSGRDYLAEARASGRTTFSGLRTRGLAFRSDSSVSVVIAEPLVDRSGAFAGSLMAGLDARALRPEMQPTADPGGHSVILIDASGRVLEATDPSLRPGTPIDSLLRGGDGSVPTVSPLGTGDRMLVFDYYPPPTGSVSSSLALDLVHATYRPVSSIGWGVVVSRPTAALHASFLPSVAWILGLVVLALAGVVVVAMAFARRLSRPVRRGAAAAARIADSPFDSVDLSPVREGGLDELDDLADALEVMRRTLQVRATAVRVRQEELENQLLHAQKMEVIGQLAGGVAHDFNNILTPILAHAELVRADSTDSDARDSLQEILDAANRGRSITRQLLAHGRKQVLNVESLDLGQELAESRRMLASLLRDDVEIDLEPGPPVPPVRADRTQFQQILMNLALNAQDAMPRGGRLSLRVDRRTVDEPEGVGDDRLEPGGWVTVTVTDDGEGIEPDTLDRIFEPFFTTKAPSRGTGLGLSTVYGIVRQHGGVIRVRSIPGEGTSFRLYFPVAGVSTE